MRPTSRTATLFVAIALIAAACGTNDPGAGGGGSPGSSPGTSPGGAPSGSAGSPADISGELTFWAMGNEGAKAGALVDAFKEEYPNVTVNLTPVDWGQAVAKLQTAIGGGETPDVTQLGTDMMGQFVETGALEPVPASFDQATYFESAWNTGVVDGTAYGVPWYVETRLLYYRTDIAETAGVDAAPTTWDELKSTATALKEQGGAEWGISLGTKNWQEYMPFVWSNGGDVMTEDGQFALDSPQAIEALAYYDSFFEDGLTPTSVPEGFDITPAFVAGSHPMFFSGPWHLGLIAEAGGADIEGKWAIAPMPRKESATSFVGGSNLAVFTDSENKDAAWAFVEFLSRPETQVAWYEEATVLPAVQSAWDDPTLADDDNLATFGTQLEDTKAQPAIPTWSEISAAINEQLERVTSGNTSPEEGAAAMEQSAESIGTGG